MLLIALNGAAVGKVRFETVLFTPGWYLKLAKSRMISKITRFAKPVCFIPGGTSLSAIGIAITCNVVEITQPKPEHLLVLIQAAERSETAMWARITVR